MKILILHRIPYGKIDYHRGIDHDAHDVTYIGAASALANIPEALRCTRVERPGREKAGIEATAWMLRSGQRFDRAVSLSEYELMDAAQVRERFSIPGPSPREVETVRDKIVMKQAAARAGVRVPRFLKGEAFAAGDEAAWNGRTVLKPVDGASSENVRLFASPDALRAALREGTTGITVLDAGDSEAGGFEIEEYVDGAIVHFDGLVREGSILTLTASRYVGTCLAYASGSPLGSFQISCDDSMRRWVDEALRAVGLYQGSFHLEAIEDGGDLCFLEVANRVGGADVVSAVELATGVHLPSAELRILLNEDAPAPRLPREDERYGWFVFPGHHLNARACRIDGHERFSNSANMLRWNMLSADALLPRTITYQAVEAPAAGVVRAASSPALEAFLRDLFATVRIVPLAVPAEAVRA